MLSRIFGGSKKRSDVTVAASAPVEVPVPETSETIAPDLAAPWRLPHAPDATAADIYHCFRLILDRAPHVEEWHGHSSRVGEPLSAVVATYVNSAEFHARRLQVVTTPPGVVSRHNGRFHVFADANDLTLGSPALHGDYEPEVAAVIAAILRPGDTFLDVGANLGYFTLLAAGLVGDGGRVYAIEPNEQNIKLLESSRRANGFGNVSVMQVAVSDRIETLFLHATVGNGNTSTLEGGELFALRTIPGLPLDTLMARREKPLRLIKIDVEGFEHKALCGGERLLREDAPHIVFEFAGNGLVGISGEDFLRWLQGFGYSLSTIPKGDGEMRPQTVAEVMADFHAAGIDHIDVLATPKAG